MFFVLYILADLISFLEIQRLQLAGSSSTVFAASLILHMRTHSEVRMYKCEFCGKGFNQKGNLKAHVYRHTGERPFKCDICGKGFTLASTLNTHKRTHAPHEPFNCRFCEKAFYQKNALKSHYIASHPFTGGISLL